ncbi:MAG: hypothetical protein HY423_11585 [Candidatus Lambdaproteobacteria bacterium]|nr:hypothetical protein [Candidatus Lambdaproteobacteria bacterium]
MNRAPASQPAPGARRRWGPLLALLLPLLAAPAGAAEFATPPGQNVALQEDLLRENVTKLARDLVGERLLDVNVHIGYVRTEARSQAAGPERIKLPGFNSFIDVGTQGQPQVVPDFARVRQITVIMRADPELKPDAIERELQSQGKFFQEKGDWLQVVAVAPLAEKPEAGAAAKGARPAETGEGKPKPPAEPPAVMARRPPPLSPEEALREPRSTMNLIQARDSYFKGDFPRALDQILQAIREQPENAQAYAMLGSIYYTMNWQSLALKYWEKSLALDPDNREIAQLVAQLHDR